MLVEDPVFKRGYLMLAEDPGISGKPLYFEFLNLEPLNPQLGAFSPSINNHQS